MSEFWPSFPDWAKDDPAGPMVKTKFRRGLGWPAAVLLSLVLVYRIVVYLSFSPTLEEANLDYYEMLVGGLGSGGSLLYDQGAALLLRPIRALLMWPRLETVYSLVFKQPLDSYELVKQVFFFLYPLIQTLVSVGAIIALWRIVALIASPLIAALAALAVLFDPYLYMWNLTFRPEGLASSFLVLAVWALVEAAVKPDRRLSRTIALVVGSSLFLWIASLTSSSVWPALVWGVWLIVWLGRGGRPVLIRLGLAWAAVIVVGWAGVTVFYHQPATGSFWPKQSLGLTAFEAQVKTGRVKLDPANGPASRRYLILTALLKGMPTPRKFRQFEHIRQYEGNTPAIEAKLAGLPLGRETLTKVAAAGPDQLTAWLNRFNPRGKDYGYLAVGYYLGLPYMNSLLKAVVREGLAARPWAYLANLGSAWLLLDLDRTFPFPMVRSGLLRPVRPDDCLIEREGLLRQADGRGEFLVKGETIAMVSQIKCGPDYSARPGVFWLPGVKMTTFLAQLYQTVWWQRLLALISICYLVHGAWGLLRMVRKSAKVAADDSGPDLGSWIAAGPALMILFLALTIGFNAKAMIIVEPWLFLTAAAAVRDLSRFLKGRLYLYGRRA